MPYSVGKKGSYGCSGYPAVKDDGTVMGCHKTKEEAAAQIFAINQSEGNIDKDIWDGSAFGKAKKPNYGSFLSGRRGEPNNRELYNRIVSEAKRKFDVYPSAVANSWVVQEYKRRGGTYRAEKAYHEEEKAVQEIKEGDFVMGMTVDGMAHGKVEHIMWEGGTLGTPGEQYALESMPPENPAMSVRLYEEEDGKWEATPYSIGMMYQDAEKLESLEGHMMEDDDMNDDMDMDKFEKAETFTPTDAMASAARRAIKYKEDGKATGAGTAVGWTRARQLANKEQLSLSTVKRMYSYFSRHEVDKKGKDWDNSESPSNGKIMWLAWGGDAGFSWSRAIVNREKNKSQKVWDGTPFQIRKG